MQPRETAELYSHSNDHASIAEFSLQLHLHDLANKAEGVTEQNFCPRNANMPKLSIYLSNPDWILHEFSQESFVQKPSKL